MIFENKLITIRSHIHSSLLVSKGLHNNTYESVGVTFQKIECSFKCNKIKYLNNKRINRIYIFFHKVCAKGQLFKLFSTSNQSNLKTGPIAKISSLFSLLSLNENK